MDEKEVGAIVSLLRERFGARAEAFEFGSGGSTLTFCADVTNWTAVEHDPAWRDKTISSLGEGAGQVTVKLVPPDGPHRGMEPAEPGQFASYIEAARSCCPDGGYDFVLVDGRARVDCMLRLAEWGLLHGGSLVALHDFKRERYAERLDELLVHYDLISAVTGGVTQGLGIFAPKAGRRAGERPQPIAEPSPGGGGGNRVVVYGFPGLYGGAGTELHHQVIAWRSMGKEVHLIPTSPGYKGEPLYPEMLERGVVVHGADEWGAIEEGDPVLGFCNAEFLANLDPIRERSRRTVFVNCMTWLFEKEKRRAAEGKIAMFLYQNPDVMEANRPALQKLAPDVDMRFATFRPYFEPSLFPFVGERERAVFGCGRISRQDTDKYAKDTLSIYERFVAPKPKSGVFLGFDRRAARKIGDPPSWIRTAADQGELSQADFYRHCEIVLQPTETTENWPRVGFEAMSSGSVLVVDNRGGWRSMVEHGATGWLCDSPSDFIYYASKMAYEPGQREDMAAAARVRALDLGGLGASQESWERVFAELEELPA